MTDREPGLGLEVAADLLLELDGHTAQLSGSGTDVVLECSDPVGLWRAANALPWPAGVTQDAGPQALGSLADGLARQGLHLDVTGPSGRVAELGRGVDSGVGHRLTGSRSVRFGSLRTLAVTAGADLRSGRALLVAGGLAALALTGWALRRR